MDNLTKEQLLKIEKKKKNSLEIKIDYLIIFLPYIAFSMSVFEYLFIKDKYQNDFMYRYVILLLISI